MNPTPAEICPDCFGWREDKAFWKEGKKIKYLKCNTCGGVWDEQNQKYQRKESSDSEPQKTNTRDKPKSDQQNDEASTNT